jgi:hypothetical protein
MVRAWSASGVRSCILYLPTWYSSIGRQETLWDLWKLVRGARAQHRRLCRGRDRETDAPAHSETMGKKSKADRSEAAVTCQCCAAAVNSKKKVVCICTRVVFCSHACQQQALSSGGGHTCPGPPKTGPTNMQEMLKSKGLKDSTQAPSYFKTAREKKQFHDEMEGTVTSPSMKALAGGADLFSLRGAQRVARQGGLRDASVENYAELADDARLEMAQRNACAYQAGILLKQRITGGMLHHGERVGHGSDVEKIGVLDTDELAHTYLLQASKRGHGLAMQSLADLYENGQGVRACMRTAREWLWRSMLGGSAGARQLLETKIVLFNEMYAHHDMFDTVANSPHFVRGRGFSPGGPNLGSLLVACHCELAALNYQLPPFASIEPATKDGQPRLTRPVYVLGAELLRRIHDRILEYESRGYPITPIYGFRGTAKSATALSLCNGEGGRALDAQRLVVPPRPAGDESPRNNGELEVWRRAAMLSPIRVSCPHCKDGDDDNDKLPTCRQCLSAACERLHAIASGAVALSLAETLRGHGHIAIYSLRDGTVTSDTFKDYGRCEAELALASLVASKGGVLLAHPLFVAQDPNLLWPLILAHGSVRAALEHCAPHIDWMSRFGAPVPLPQQTPLADGAAVPGAVVLRCGADICLHVIPEASSAHPRSTASAAVEGSESSSYEGIDLSFAACGRCNRKRYCSAACQKADWPLHRTECVPRPPKASPSAALPTTKPSPTPSAAASAPAAVATSAAELHTDEEVILTGLVSKPHLNGRTGKVLGARTEAGRHPVDVDGTSMALKPDNLLRLGVSVVKRRFRCTEHQKELCEECCLDLSIIAHCCKLRRSQGDPTVPLPIIERVVTAHFAKLKRGSLEDYARDCEVGSLAHRDPLCDAVPDAARRAVLTAARKVERPSITVAATTAGIACFAARENDFIRPLVIEHVARVVNMPMAFSHPAVDIE